MILTQTGAHTFQNLLGEVVVIGGGIIGLKMGTVSCGAVWAPKLPSSSFSKVFDQSKALSSN